MGSAALDLAYVAAGRFDGFFEFGLQPWDIAAGAIIIQEAGGMVTQIDGGPLKLSPGNGGCWLSGSHSSGGRPVKLGAIACAGVSPKPMWGP